MNEDLHNIDDLFKKAIDEHEELPSANVWENIDRNLDKKKVVFISKKYKNLKWAVAALLIFSSGLAMYIMRSHLKQNDVVQQSKSSGQKATVKSNEVQPAEVMKKETGEKGIKNADVTGPSAAPKDTTNLAENKKDLDDKRVEDKTVITKQGGKKAAGLVEKNSSKGENASGKTDTESADKHPFKNIDNTGKNAAGDTVSANTNNHRDEKENTVSAYDAVQNERLREKITAVNERKDEPEPLQLPGAFLQRTSANIIEVSSVSSLKKTVAGKGNFRLKNKGRLSATLFFSPDFVSSSIDNDHHTYRDEDRDEIKKKEENKLSGTAGVLLGYQIAKNWSVQSGLTFSKIVTDIKPKTIFARPDNSGNISYRFNCSAGYSYVNLKSAGTPAAGDSVNALSSTNTLQYIAVPFAVQYHIGKGKLTFSPGIGFAANFLTKGKIETVIAGQSVNEKAVSTHLEGLHSTYYNASVSAGVSYDITKEFAFSFTPAARLALTPINSQAPVKTYLNSIGFAAGLTMKF